MLNNYYIKSMIKISAFCLSFLLFGCTTPMKTKNVEFKKNRAYIVLGLRGNMEINEARYCNFVCSAWFDFGKENMNGVHVFEVRIGKKFLINELYSGPFVAPFQGKELEIDTPGVYYYGIIQSYEGKTSYFPEPSEEVLRKVIEKYGREITKIDPIGFEWPVFNE